MSQHMFVYQDLEDIARKVIAAERLTFEDGVRLLKSDHLLAIGAMADQVRRKHNGTHTYFVVNRHINYTNVCTNECRFCAFQHPREHPDAYTMSLEEIFTLAAEHRDQGIRELHIVGGLDPDLPYDYYLDMMRGLKERMPDVHLKAFTMVEIEQISAMAGKDVAETLGELKKAGLDSLPGGGAEIFSPTVREQLCPRKISGERWLEIARAAHLAGLKSNATMLYGHIESIEDRIDHLIRLRDLQDETGGFQAFIPLAFHPEKTGLSTNRITSGCDDLKTIAVSRLMLDNIPHIKAYWVMVGLKLAQVAQNFGADDLDGTIVEERITHSAGGQTPRGLTRAELVQLIRSTGMTPVERDTMYNIVRIEE